MTLYYNSKQKIRNIYRTIDALLDGDFPLISGQSALQKLRDVFAKIEANLDRAAKLKNTDVERQLASLLNVKIYQSLPILGFILRSTNVRNAFELLDPFQSIADAILQGKPRLLLSSEWDYIPFAYPQSLEDLRSFVLIGLPASEAGSALLAPLAGHELGHAVWRNRGLGGGIHALLQARCTDLYNKNMEEFQKHFPEYKPDDIVYKELLPEAIGRSVEYAVRQAEELFCDMFGYALFGVSYLYAFAYILAPGSGRVPGPTYPTYNIRITTLQKIAEKEGVTLPDVNALHFMQEAPRGLPRERFVIRMAETSVQGILDGLWTVVSDLISAGKVRRPSTAMSARHLREFQMSIPAHEPVCLGDIINAGWLYYKEIQDMKLAPEKKAEAIDTLNEIVLKTVEVLEYKRRLSS